MSFSAGAAFFRASDALLVGDTRCASRSAHCDRVAAQRRPFQARRSRLSHQRDDFRLAALPKRLPSSAGGPLGCEAAHTFRGWHARTIVQDEPKFLPQKKRRFAASVVFVGRDGVDTRLNTLVLGVRVENGSVKILDTPMTMRDTGSTPTRSSSASVVRRTSVTLAWKLRYRVRSQKKGHHCRDFLRTTNRRVYAAGTSACRSDSPTPPATARMAVQNALPPSGRRLSLMTIPWCTMRPRDRHVGMHVWDASERSVPVKSFT